MLERRSTSSLDDWTLGHWTFTLTLSSHFNVFAPSEFEPYGLESIYMDTHLILDSLRTPFLMLTAFGLKYGHFGHLRYKLLCLALLFRRTYRRAFSSVLFILSPPNTLLAQARRTTSLSGHMNNSIDALRTLRCLRTPVLSPRCRTILLN